MSKAHARRMNSDLLRQSPPHDPAPHHNGPHHTGLWVRFLARALAVRARAIVSPAGRQELARRWTGVMDLTGRPPVPSTPRGPLCRGRIAATERDVGEMISVLAGGSPIDARGAAMASWFLRDGTGPLHNHRSPLGLGAEVREATRQMVSLADAPADRADRDSAGCFR